MIIYSGQYRRTSTHLGISHLLIKLTKEVPTKFILCNNIKIKLISA